MIDFGGIYYSIDLDALEKSVQITTKGDDIVDIEKKTYMDGNGNIISVEVTEHVSERAKEINAAKYEIIRTMLEVVMDDTEETDDSLGAERGLAKTTLSYKIAFNTLVEYGVLKEME